MIEIITYKLMADINNKIHKVIAANIGYKQFHNIWSGYSDICNLGWCIHYEKSK